MQIPLLWNLWLGRYKLGLILPYQGDIDFNISIMVCNSQHMLTFLIKETFKGTFLNLKTDFFM